MELGFPAERIEVVETVAEAMSSALLVDAGRRRDRHHRFAVRSSGAAAASWPLPERGRYRSATGRDAGALGFGSVSTSPVACRPHDHGTHARTLQAGCRRAWARRRDRRPHRAQGTSRSSRSSCVSSTRRPRSSTTPSTTASRSSTIWSRSSHARRWSRWSSRARTRGRSMRTMMGTTNPREAAPGNDSRRSRDRAHREPRARKRRSGVGCARDRTVLSGAGRDRLRRLRIAELTFARRVAGGRLGS